MKPTLLIFIDGLPFQLAIENMDILKGAACSPLVPGIGFSNNIYPEMLCGLTPDEIGYFNEWSPKPNIETQKKLKLFPLLDTFRNFLYINAGLRKIILRKIFKINYSNIPFKYAHLFKPQGSHDFKDLGENSILAQKKFLIYDSVYESGGVGNRDPKVMKLLLNKEIPNQNLFISLIDLDNIAHIHRNASEKHLSHLEYLDQKLGVLIRRFKEKHKDCNVFLFSDHGMVNVERGDHVQLNIEEKFGDMDPKKYLYFVDSTYLRVWVKDKKLGSKIKQYLESLDYGNILLEDEREEFGLTNREFGDYIFRTKEGICFTPNFYGARKVKAMHGFDSKLESQKGIFADLTKKSTTKLPSRSKEVYNFLKNEVQ